MKLPEIQQRWEVFLNKIEDRFNEVISKSEEVLPLIFEHSELETVSFINAWTGIYQQCLSLYCKIEDTWHDKIEALILDAGYDIDSREMVSERNKGFDRRFKLESELKAAEIRVHAKASYRLIEEVKKRLEAGFACTQCQAPLPLRKDFFRSYYTTCNYCQTVNTFEPGSLGRNVEHFALHALAEEAGWPFQLEYDKAIHENYKSFHDVYHKDQLVALYQQYVEAYLKRRIAIIPEYQDRYEKDLQAKMDFLIKYS